MITPQQFAKRYVNVPFEDYVCLVHDPRESSPQGRTFTVEYLGNVVGGGDVIYLNVDIDLIKQITMQSILDGQPVWFGCDTGKMMQTEIGLWDKELFDYKGVYDTDFSLSKAERLLYGESAMTHAMVFTGVDVVDGKARRWRVENSWGDDVGKKGFFLMNDSWDQREASTRKLNKGSTRDTHNLGHGNKGHPQSWPGANAIFMVFGERRTLKRLRSARCCVVEVHQTGNGRLRGSGSPELRHSRAVKASRGQLSRAGGKQSTAGALKPTYSTALCFGGKMLG